MQNGKIVKSVIWISYGSILHYKKKKNFSNTLAV